MAIDYSEPPQLGEKWSKSAPLPDPRNEWWNKVLKAAAEFHGDFMELKNCPVTWNTVRHYLQRPLEAPDAFSDPGFEIVRLDNRLWVRYFAEKR